MHQLSDPKEQKRIVEAGFGITKSRHCTRVFNPLNKTCGINMTRTIGDFMFKMNLRSRNTNPSLNALSNEPDIKEVNLSQKGQSIDLVLMGCDGIWEGTVGAEEEYTSGPREQTLLPDGYQLF